MDAYPATQNYIPQEKLNPPGIVKRLSAEELTTPKSPLELIAQGDALPKAGTGAVSVYNPREEFKGLGWTVYEDSGLKSSHNKTYMSRITADRFVQRLEGIKGIFSDIEYSTVQKLLTQNPNNDKVTIVYVTTDNYMTIRVKSNDKSVGLDGVYLLLKPLTQADADKVRKLAN